MGRPFLSFSGLGMMERSFFDRKKRYSLNAQVICDCNKNITAFITGWLGSCADSFVFKKMLLAKEQDKFFDAGTRLIYSFRFFILSFIYAVADWRSFQVNIC